MIGGGRQRVGLAPLLVAAAALALSHGAALGSAEASVAAAAAAAGQMARPPAYYVPAVRPVYIQPLRIDVRTGLNGHVGRIVFDWPVATGYEVRQSGQTVNIIFNRPGFADVEGLEDELPDHVVAVAAQPLPGGLRIAMQVRPKIRIRHFREGNNIILDVLGEPPPPRVVKPKPKKKKKIVRKKPKPKEPLTRGQIARLAGPDAEVEIVREKSKSDRATGGLVSVSVTGDAGRIAVRFNWRRNVAMAAYRRGGNLWVFFDRSARIDLGGIRYIGRKMVHGLKQYRFKDTVLIRMAIPPEVHVAASLENSAWMLTISAHPPRSPDQSRFIAVRTETDAKDRARVVLPVKGAHRHFRLRDPEAGDIVDIIPVGGPGQGIRTARHFIEFELFESVQGIAIRPIAEDLTVHAGRDKIIVYAAQGLMISDRRDISERKAKKGEFLVLDRIRDWQLGPASQFEEIKTRLLDNIVKLPLKQRKNARMELARFYLSHRMAAEASGVLQVVARADQSAQLYPEFRALRGAANYLLAHYAEAASDFVDPQMREERNAWPWLAGIAAARGDWSTAYNLSQGTEEVLAGHPPWLALHFRSVFMEAALIAGDVKQAAKLHRAIVRGGGTEEQKSFAEYLRGFLLKKSGRAAEAIDVWSKLETSPHRRARARASFAAINARLETKKIDVKKAIAGLEGLGFLWRGGAFEFDLLHRLGDLYVAVEDYRNALIRYRKAATYFKNVRGTQTVASKLRATFRKLYLEGASEKMLPVKALALFQEFRELTPPGEDGDEMYRRLADRLVAIDLLPEADELLQKQIEFRLKGELKARVGMRLALIRLLDRRPKDALAALDATKEPEIGSALARERRMMRARALAGLGRNDAAIAALGDAAGADIRELKLAILWRAAKWKEADVIARTILGGGKLDPSDEVRTRLVMQRAVALAMTADEAGLAALRRDYGAAMAKSKRAEAFRAITEKSREAAPDFQALARQASDLDSYRGFLDSYRKRTRSAAVNKPN